MGGLRTPLRTAGAGRRPVAPVAQRAVQPVAAARLQQRIGLQGTQALLARAPAIQRRAAEPGAVAGAGGMRVSAPSDPAEREAEGTANKVMRAATPEALSQAGGAVARKAEGGAEPPASLPAGFAAAGGSGTPLPPQVRAFMEPRFGTRFGHVRIHTGQPAAQMSAQLQARAFTVGSHIFFGKGQYRPDTPDGLELIAHELTHTIQQGGAVQRRAAPDGRAPEQVQRSAAPEAGGSFLASVAALAQTAVPHWDLLTGVLGKDPISGAPTPPGAEGMIGGFMKLIGQEEVWENIKKAKAEARAWAWMKGAIAGLKGYVAQIPARAASAFKSLGGLDLLLPWRAVKKLAAAFGNFVGDFARWAGDAVWTLLEIVFDVVSPGAARYVKKAGAALKSILKHPIQFVGNLVKAAKLGFTNFGANFGGHLKEKLLDWLTGALPDVYVPKAFSLREIVKFAFSVLRIGWQFIRQKLVRAVGEPAVAGMERSYDFVKRLVTEGPVAAWENIKEHVGDIKQTVVGGITSFVVEMVVVKAIPKLLALFIPGAGFITAIVSIYDVIMVFVQKLATIVQVVNDFIGSIGAIAAGAIGTAAGKVEGTLKGLLALAISFFARFAGIGKISDKVMAVLAKIRAPIEKALDALVKWIVAGAKKLGKLVVQAGVPADPKERLRLGMDAALRVVNRYERQRVGQLILTPLLAGIRVRYGFLVLEVLPIGGIWWVNAEINPKKKEPSKAIVEKPEHASPAPGSSGRRGKWRITRERTERVLYYEKFGKFYKSASDGLWWSKDLAGHGDSQWKVFRETSKGLAWFRDADEFGNFIVGKHKGDVGMFISWDKLSGVNF